MSDVVIPAKLAREISALLDTAVGYADEFAEMRGESSSHKSFRMRAVAMQLEALASAVETVQEGA